MCGLRTALFNICYLSKFIKWYKFTNYIATQGVFELKGPRKNVSVRTTTVHKVGVIVYFTCCEALSRAEVSRALHVEGTVTLATLFQFPRCNSVACMAGNQGFGLPKIDMEHGVTTSANSGKGFSRSVHVI